MASVTLKASGSISSSANGQKIVGLLVTGTITITHDDVVVMGCQVNHSGGKGIVANGANHPVIINTYCNNVGAPTGQTAEESDGYNNIELVSCPNARIHKVRLRGGSAGAYALSSDRCNFTQIEGYNFRGPFPRGQLVQFNQCEYVRLVGFSCIMDPDNSWSEDNISLYRTPNSYVAEGLLDGNNSPSGAGVMLEGSPSCTVEDVDCLRQGNGCFSAFSITSLTIPAQDIYFTRCNGKDTILTDQGRGVPLSGGKIYTSYNADQSNVNFSGKWYNHDQSPTYHTPTITGNGGSVNITEEDFTARAAIEHTFAWE